MTSSHPRQNLKTKLKDARRRLTRAVRDPKHLGHSPESLVQLWISYWNRVRNFVTTRVNVPDPDPQAESWNNMVQIWKDQKDLGLPDIAYRTYPDPRAQNPKTLQL